MAPFPPERESDQSGNEDSTVPGGNRGIVFAPFGNVVNTEGKEIETGMVLREECGITEDRGFVLPRHWIYNL
ncbi:hypothetical protein N7530_006108 [Penicillium desertorum]|uniref:Uncharacterized protein n=1 Tax=Penicillium desertorum TaxID=1303715 RepID=A0A9W9X1E9_9EURO|nr:hypothetical protein N7530_006108 [Penicillium desertorum]